MTVLLTRDNIDLNNFYKSFSTLHAESNGVEELIIKVWELIGQDVLLKDIVYLSLLANKNFDLLKRSIRWDKNTFQLNINDASSYFDYTVFFKNHWFNELIHCVDLKALETFQIQTCDKIILLQIINAINNTSGEIDINWLINRIGGINIANISDIWTYFINEIKYLLKVVEFCQSRSSTSKSLEKLHFAGRYSLLEIFSQYLNLHNDCNDCNFFLSDTISSNLSHHEDFQDQLKTLTCYSIISQFFKLIIPYKSLEKVNVNDEILNIQKELINIEDFSMQIDLLELVFAMIFMKKSHIKHSVNTDETHDYSSMFVCNQQEVRLILFTLKEVIDHIWLKNLYPPGSDEIKRLEQLRKYVFDALWRLEIIENLKSGLKCEKNLLYYMLAEPEALVNICLKYGHFARASEVLEIFNLTETPLAQKIYYAGLLEELKINLKRTAKIKLMPDVDKHSPKFNYEEIVKKFLQKHPTIPDEDSDKIIQQNRDIYPFLEHYRSEKSVFLNVLDLAITQSSFFEDTASLFNLASKYNSLSETESHFSRFGRSLKLLFDEIGPCNKYSASDILLNSSISLDVEKHKEQLEFYIELETLYTKFCNALTIDEDGVFNKNHLSHQILLHISKLCCQDPGSVKYLQKLFNYLKAFSEVLYIESDTSNLISNNKNTSFFELLTYNRSELMGKLLFELNLDPIEFEKYFKKLKLDFLYHVTGNCFPTINLHMEEDIDEDELYHENFLYTPNKAVIAYILKRNRLLALILNEMYHVEGVEVDVNETRIQNLLNYLRLPRIEHLKCMYNDSEILTVLQNDIPYKKVKDFVDSEMGRHDFTSSTFTNQSFEAAEEISEEGVTSVWKRLADMIDSIPERQNYKEQRFSELRDMLLAKLVTDAFECEYYKNVLYIKDRDIRINLLLDNMKTWPMDFCVKCIKDEISRFDVIEDEKIEELKAWLKHIEHSMMVMEVLGITAWSDMYNMCAFEPTRVITKLLIAQKIDLLIEVIDLHEVSNTMLLCVDAQFLAQTFEIEDNLNSVESLLKILPQPHCIAVCKEFLNTLKNVDHLQFIANVLSTISEDRHLSNISLSLKILSAFPPNEHAQHLLALLNDPLSIIEGLVMNTKLDRLGAVLKLITDLIPVCDSDDCSVSVESIDELLRHYARKSLDFRVVTHLVTKLKPSEAGSLKSSSSFAGDTPHRSFVMPEDVPTKQEWVQNTEVTECMCCSNVLFSMFNRRHHCRRCGRVVCSACSKKRMIVHNYGDILVRVCLDCFHETFKDQSVSEDNRSSWSLIDDFWILTDDPEHNRIVREEFSYEFAPSVSLFLSLMKFHSKTEEYSKFLLEQCEVLLKLLMPSNELTREIDYLLVIRMLKSLAVAVKMASLDTSLQYGSSIADTIMNQASLLELLAERGCLQLLPVIGESPFVDAISIRRLTDKLLETEQWNLALEVSTKAGLDNSGVFVAWGKSCLKAGCLMLAREKFSKCLDRTASHHEMTYLEFQTSTLKVAKTPPLLNDIIKILESKKESIDETVLKTVDGLKFSGSTTTLNQSSTSAFQSEGALFILNKINNLKDIENGSYNSTKDKFAGFSSPRLDPVIYEECVYYLAKYGNSVSLVEFHLKYKQYEKLLRYMVEKRLSHEVFIHIYMKCLKEGTVELLQAYMSQIDSSLMIWQNYLRKICFHLEKQNLLNCLYQLQQYMGDYVRAAMTCIRFYEQNSSSFTDLVANKLFMEKSVEHLKQALEQEQWVDVSPVEMTESRMSFEEKSITNPLLIKKMSYRDIEKNMQTIHIQCQVTQFLANRESSGVFPMQIYSNILPNPDNLPRDKIKIPTLFGSADDKKFLAVLCIICGETVPEGFKFAITIINEFKLKPIKVFNEAGKYLAQTEKFGSIAELVDIIRKNSDAGDKTVTEMCDEMLIHAVATLTKARAPEAQVESLIRFISDKAVKISAYIEARQLKTAYFLATKYKRIMDIRRILKEAEMLNQPNIRILCQKALQKYSQTSNTDSEAK